METEDQEKKQVLRAFSTELGLLSRCDGSATFTTGDTSVLAAVYGPAEVRVSKELIDKATVEVVYKPKVGMPGCSEKSQEKLIRNTCEAAILAALHPRSSISVVLQEVQNSGSLLACCINSSCLSLLDAAIPMKFYFSAVTCVIDSDDEVHLDPTKDQEEEAKAIVTFAFDNKDLNIITATSKGCFTQEQFQRCTALCREASKSVFEFVKESMNQKLSKLLQE
ncbi:exosome complex component RRP46-like isoform X2 [Lineus longissimus]